MKGFVHRIPGRPNGAPLALTSIQQGTRFSLLGDLNHKYLLGLPAWHERNVLNTVLVRQS